MNSEEYSNSRVDPDTFDVLGTFRTIRNAARHNKLLIWLTVAFSLGLVSLYIYVWPPIYQAQATIMVERDTDTVRDHFYEDWDVFRKDDARSEMELISAGPILKEVIQKEGLTYDDVYHPFMSHATYLWQKSWLGRNYKAFKDFITRKKRQPDEPSAQDMELARTILDMKAGVTLEPVSEANVGKLTVKGPTRRVGKITNTLLAVYQQRRAERFRNEAQDSYEALATDAKKAEQEMDALAQRREEFAQAHELTFDFQKETLQVGKLAELELEIAGSQSKIASMKASLQEVEDELKKEPVTYNSSTVYELNALREATKQKRLDIETALIQARQRFREDSPEVTDLKRTQAGLDALIAESSDRVEKTSTEAANTVRQELVTKRNVLRADMEGSEAGLAVMEDTAAKLRTRLDQLPAWQTEMREYDRDLQIAQQKYEHLSLRREQAEVSASSANAMPSLRVVEYATTPDLPWWPRMKILYPSTLAVGYLLGLLIAFIKSYADGLVHREHVERGRGSARLYGVVVANGGSRPLSVVSRGPESHAASATGQD